MFDDLGLDSGDVAAEDACTDMPPEVEEVFSSPDQPPMPPKKDNKKRNRVIAIIAVALVVIIAAGAVAVPAIIRAVNPKAAVLAALAKTMDNAGFDDAAAIAADLQKGAFEQGFSLRLGEEMPASLRDSLSRALTIAPDRLSGTGISLFTQMDKAQRKAAMSFGVDLGVYHAGDIQLFADNNILSIGSPELTNRRFYWLDTETLGADWNANEFWSTVEGVDEDMSFNFFDLMDETAGKSSADALLSLNKASTMTKDDGGAYTLTIPAEALRDYLRTTLSDATVPDADDIADLIGGDATVLFAVKDGAVTRMELTLPLTTGDTQLLPRFCMTPTEEGGLSFLLDVAEGISISAKVRVSTDKAAKQLSLDIPEIIFTSDADRLTMGAVVTMEPLTEFAFQPESPVALMELDQNGVLELLFGALGGLQTITEEMSTN